MKKIISLLSVFAMIATLFTNVAFADANNDLYFKKVDTGVANEAKLVLVLKTNQDIVSFGATIDMANIINGGATVKSFAKLDNKFTYNVVSASKVITVSYTDTTLANTLSGEYEIGEVIFDTTNFKNDASFAQKRGITAKNAANESVASAFSSSAYSYVLEAAKAPADRTAAVKFAADENTYVEITKGAEVKNYFLPSNVKGDATVYGLLKYKVDGTNVKSGDVFTINAVDMETKDKTKVESITVE